MYFNKQPKNGDTSGKSLVYMQTGGKTHYVCEMSGGNTAEDVVANELGLTLRARLNRSKGKYAMLEGTIFNPERLLDAVCEVADYKEEAFTGGDYKDGYTLLSVTADGCVNKYMIFSASLLNSLVSKLKARLKAGAK